ncbi:MAG TPA: FmdB family zinc ribbon protein [Acidimicrobiales bacterium]
MPTYEYRCKSCGTHHDVVQKFGDDPLTECPSCGGPLRKVFGAVGVVFKGSGFYKTDSRTSAKKSERSDKAEKSEKADKSEKSDTKTAASDKSGSGSSDASGSKSSDSTSGTSPAPKSGASTSTGSAAAAS